MMNTLMDRQMSEMETAKIVGGSGPIWGYRVYLKDGSFKTFRFRNTAEKYASANGGTLKRAIVGVR